MRDELQRGFHMSKCLPNGSPLWRSRPNKGQHHLHDCCSGCNEYRNHDGSNVQRLRRSHHNSCERCEPHRCTLREPRSNLWPGFDYRWVLCWVYPALVSFQQLYAIGQIASRLYRDFVEFGLSLFERFSDWTLLNVTLLLCLASYIASDFTLLFA